MIKIVSFSGGLGNQLFQYLLVVYLRECGHQVYGYYNRKWLIGHNGLEVNNVFDIYLPKTNFIVNALVKVIRVLRCLGLKKYVATDTYDNPIAIFYDGYWQDQKYFNIIDSKLSFKKFDLSAENKSILSKIKSNISVALHIRCGDYLSSSNVEIYGGVCTKEYYEKALELVCKIKNVMFFVFSDDIEYAKLLLNLPNAIYVNANVGNSSFIDMYLMANCKVNVIANSTFSYWAARLNQDNILTIYPKKWYNSKYAVPDIFPSEWVGV